MLPVVFGGTELYTLVKQSTTAQAVIAVINTQGERCDVLHNLASGARLLCSNVKVGAGQRE